MSRESDLTQLWLKWVESELSQVSKFGFWVKSELSQVSQFGIWVESELSHLDCHMSRVSPKKMSRAQPWLEVCASLHAAARVTSRATCVVHPWKVQNHASAGWVYPPWKFGANALHRFHARLQKARQTDRREGGRDDRKCQLIPPV